MGNGLTAFLISIGISAWIFNKIYKTTGGDTSRSLSAAAVAGVLIFLISLTILGKIN